MSIDESVKEYENDFFYMIHNKFPADVVMYHFYSYRRHLDQYSILQRPEPENRFAEVNKVFKEYVKNERRYIK